MKFMGDLSFAIYFDFETILHKKIYNFDKDCTLYPVSYALVVAFHPELDAEKFFVVRSFNHTFEQLNDFGYLANEMLPYFSPKTACQLRDCALAIYNKKEKFLLPEMFSCELKFVTDLLKKWLADKYFRRFKETDYFTKQNFKRKNPINRDETKCHMQFSSAHHSFRLSMQQNNDPHRLCGSKKASIY